MKRRWPSLALLSVLFILQACGVETKDSRLGIIGGQVWNKTPSPVVAYTVVAGSSVSGPAFSRTCTATRVSDTDFITAANCFDNYLSNNGKLAFITASTGDRLSGISIKSFRNHEAFDPTSDTGSNNIAIFTITESTPKLNETVLKADIDLTRPATGQAIEVFGGGCDSVNAEGACASKSTWLGGVIKSFQTKVAERDDLPANLSGKFFFSNSADGSFAGDDLGGPVFKYDPSHTSWKLIGLNTPIRAVFKKEQAYAWIGHTDNSSFLRTDPNSDHKDSNTSLNAGIEQLLVDIQAELTKCGATAPDTTIAVSLAQSRTVPRSGALRLSSSAAGSQPCPSDPASREARIKALYIAQGYALAAKEALEKGNVEDAQELYTRAKEMFEIALKITDFALGLTPAGRAISAFECLSGIETLPELVLNTNGKKEFKFQKLDKLGQFMACVSAVGLDEKLMKYAGSYLMKFSVISSVVGKAEVFMQTMLKPADRMLSGILNSFEFFQAKAAKQRLAQTLQKLEKALGSEASEVDVQDFIDVSAKLRLTDADQIEGLAGMLGSPAEVKKLKAIVDGLSLEDAELLGIAKGKMPHLDTDEVLEVIKDLKDWNFCKTLGALNSRVPQKSIFNSLFRFALSARPTAISNECLRSSFNDLVSRLNLAPSKWGIKGVTHALWGDFTDMGTHVILSGGMHTEEGLQRLVSLNAQKGFTIEVIVHALETENISFNLAQKTAKIFKTVRSDGVVVLQFPKELMKQPNSFVDGSKRVKYFKTMFPSNMSMEDIFDSCKSIDKPSNLVIKNGIVTSNFEAFVNVKGNNFKLFSGFDADDGLAFSFYPKIN